VLTSLRCLAGWSVSLMSVATSAARTEMSVASVSGSAMTYPLPLIPEYPHVLPPGSSSLGPS